MSEACGLAFNSDDTMAYVTSRFYGGIYWLTRSASTGALTGQSYLTTSDHAGKSYQAIAVVVAKDDKFVYVFGAEHGYILWFTVNLLSTGNTHLSYTGQVAVSGWTGQGTSRTTPSTQTMVISPDGKSIYVSAFKDSGFAEFSVNTVTGAATEVKHFTDGAGGVDGLNNASCVAVTAEGASVYVGSLGEAKVVQFSKNLGCVTCAVGKTSLAGSTLSTQCTVRFE
jgi:6-phosphogluconolactonase (cycloisomerase 2 family)